MMLESNTGVDVLKQCLEEPESAISTVKMAKKEIIDKDLISLISSVQPTSSAYYVSIVAKQISWRKLWDLALNRGVRGTRLLQSIVFVVLLSMASPAQYEARM